MVGDRLLPAEESLVPQSPDWPIIEEEERLLERNRRLLQENPQGPGASEHDLVIELRRLQEEIASAKTEDVAAMLQQYDQALGVLRQLRRGRSSGEVDPDCPYFAHLRLQEQERRRDLFLGRATRLDNGMRIVDWRNAPISGIFYRYREGDRYEEEIAGRPREGVVDARRTLSIEGGRLLRVSSPQGVFSRDGGGRWHRRDPHPHRLAGGQGSRVVARASPGPGRLGGGAVSRIDKHLPQIAALIDPEQFELITQPDSGVVVLRGTAGSGKTTVALHRVAWLCYQDPDRFRPDRMAVVVWGRALRDYISGVLPALGVDGVPVRTWAEWSRALVRRHFRFLPRRRAATTPEVVTRLKLHPALLQLIQDHVATHAAASSARGAFEDWCTFFTGADALEAGLDRLAPGAFSRDEVLRVVDWSREQQRSLLPSRGGRPERGAELDQEDDAILLRLHQLRAGYLGTRRRRLSYAHLVLDEVQDFSPVEVRVLLDSADRQRCVTLAGDTRQHIMEASGFSDWDAFFEQLGIQGHSVSTLRIGYRSTRSITAFAAGVLGPEAGGDPVVATAEGAPVELLRFTDHGACVAFLAEALVDLARREPIATVALISRNAGISALYHDGLARAEVPRLRRVVDQRFAFAPGVEITEVSEVKGLEFDYVVLLEVSATCYPEDSYHRRLLHVGATRAAHQLWLTSVGTPSRLVSSLIQPAAPEG